ncbi:MAG: (d)CMP kinase [candidate division NC10 bacterium]|nr:(d)CMP kinase [candidate division NC10 bacterium]
MREAGRARGGDGGTPEGPPGKPRERLVIAIDGPVGAGKSTMARRLARALGIVHIDSGAMYRAMGWKAMQAGVELSDHAALASLAERTEIRVIPGDPSFCLLVDGEDVTGRLRTPAVDRAASLVSTCPAVRERLVALQRAMAREGGVVMDGRDIGTVVFPHADLKFFLEADLEVRAARRWQDLQRAGAGLGVAEVREEVARRDARDSGREMSPLRAAEDALRIDTTGVAPDEVLARMLAAVERCAENSKR